MCSLVVTHAIGMSQSPKKITCIFCGQRRSRAREDIVSKWVSEEIGGVGPFDTDHIGIVPGAPQSARRSRSGSLASLKLHDVCASCNSGWMSRLEDNVKPVLIPMIQGRPTTLSVAQQRLIAAWAQLKALTLDAYYPVRHLPASIAYDFSKIAQPLMNSFVAIGAFAHPEQGAALPFARQMVNIGSPLTGGVGRLVKVTFAFKYLVLQCVVGTVDLNCWPPESLARAGESRLAQCWPQNALAAVGWAPTMALSLDEFWRLSQ